MSAPKTLDDIERDIETACETRVIHVTELATRILDLIGVVRHDNANLQQQINHQQDLIKALQSGKADTRKETT